MTKGGTIAKAKRIEGSNIVPGEWASDVHVRRLSHHPEAAEADFPALAAHVVEAPFARKVEADPLAEFLGVCPRERAAPRKQGAEAFHNVGQAQLVLPPSLEHCVDHFRQHLCRVELGCCWADLGGWLSACKHGGKVAQQAAVGRCCVIGGTVETVYMHAEVSLLRGGAMVRHYRGFILTAGAFQVGGVAGGRSAGDCAWRG